MQGRAFRELSQALAARVDRGATSTSERSFVDQLVALMRKDHLLSVVVPTSHGGPALGTADVAGIAFDIGRISASAGLLYAMHLSQAMSVVNHASQTVFFDRLLRRMHDEQLLIASGTSEQGVGGDVFTSSCTVDGGPNQRFHITKQSPNISYLDHADLVLITAMQTKPGQRAQQVLVAADVADINLQPGSEAGFLGMQGLSNRSYLLTADFPAEAIFPDPYAVIARVTMTPAIHILWAAVWSGLAARILDKARACLAQAAGTKDVDATKRQDLSRLVNKHFLINAAIRAAIADYDGVGREYDDTGLARTARSKRLKVVCAELLNEICQGALVLIGLGAYAVEGPFSLAEEIRDALSAPVMISNYRLLDANSRLESFVQEEL